MAAERRPRGEPPPVIGLPAAAPSTEWDPVLW